MNKFFALSKPYTGWPRTAWILFACLNAVLLVAYLVRWTQGLPGVENALFPTGLLIMALAYVFRLEGKAFAISLMVSSLVLFLSAFLFFFW